MRFVEKTAVITGGTGALGRTVVKRFLELGANVAVPTRRPDARNSLDIPDSPRLFLGLANIAIEPDVQSFVEQVVQRFGSIHFLVNIAGGYTVGKPVAEVNLEDWQSMMNANLTTTFLMSRAVLPIMINARFGRIVSIGSMQALAPKANSAPYAVSKRGVITLTEVIAEEVKGKGITANAIVPSIIASDESMRTATESESNRRVTPDEIAATIMFLCSEEASSINGNALKMYGGF
jgi:NAD(P)-dependent dehydrogenase (short-subunit alcohol dehydrogenase family)